MLSLPLVPQSALNIVPIDDRDLPKRYLHPGELDTVIALMRLVVAPVLAVEFGVNEGRTAIVALRSLPTLKHYIGVDTDPDYIPSLTVQRHERPKAPGHYAKGDPRFELLTPARGSLDLEYSDIGPANIIFIDGDHSHRAVAHDTMLAHKLVEPGGIIIWHDYNDDGIVGVAEVLHAQQRAGRDIKHIEGTWLAYERA